MTIARRTFRAVFWETEDFSSRPALVCEYDTLEEAEGEIAGQLTRSNYRVAGLYEWDEERQSGRELEMFKSGGLPPFASLHIPLN